MSSAPTTDAGDAAGSTVTLVVDPALPWGWIAIVRDRLVAAAVTVEIVHRSGPSGLPPLFGALEMLERTVFGAGARRYATRGAVLSATRPGQKTPGQKMPRHDLPGHDLPGDVVDLSFQADAAAGSMRPLFDGAPGVDAAIGALLNGRPPAVALVRDGRTLASALPAIDDLTALVRSLEQFFASLADLLVSTILHPGLRIARDGTVPDDPPPPSPPPSTTAFFARALADKIAGRIRALSVNPEHWQVGYRHVERGLWETGDWSGPPHRPIADDRRRYYADPFAVRWNGREFVFVEEYPYASGVGILAVSEITDGVASEPRPIIETGYHMSYPQVFEHRGAIYMLPETSSNGTVELWRCEDMPGRWERVAVLVADVEVVDATLAFADDGVWLFASSRPAGASACYMLGVWHAADLFGPYRELDVRVADARTARPAGAMRRHGEGWLRPAQDCSRRYGGAVTLCRVDRLDPTGAFEQRFLRRIAPPAGFTGFHTLNTAGTLEVVDLCGQVSRGAGS